MMTHQRNVYNWEFVFLGANIDAVQTAGSLGISPQMAKTYTATPTGCRSTYTVMNKLLNYMKANDTSAGEFREECCSILSEVE